MKTKLKLLITLLTLVAFTSTQAAVTGRSADSSLAGTEKLLSDSSGTDTYITLSTLWGTAAPLTAGITATGSSSWNFSGSTGTFLTSSGLNTFGGSGHAFASILYPSANDGAALGDATHGFSDLFLASGAVININNSNWIATHTSGILTVGTGDLRVTTAGTNTASVVTVGGTQTLTAKTLTAPVIGGGLTASGSASNDFSASTGTFKTSTGVNTFGGSTHTFAGDAKPAVDGTGNLGTAALSWDNLYLDTAATINFDNGNAVLTHSSGILTLGTGELRVTTAGTNAASVPTLGSTSTLTNKTLTAPVINGATSASGNFDLSGSSGTFLTSSGANTFGGSAHTFASTITPASDDGGALGTTSLQWSDLCLASGAVIRIANTNWVATHTSGILTVGTGDLRVTTAGTNTASVVTVGGTQTLTSKTLTSPVIATGLTASGSAANTFAGSTGTFITSTGVNTFKGSAHNFDAVLQPTTDDVAALGTTLLGFSDLFLATGGTVHFGNTDWVATHSTGVLTVGTGNIIISTAGTAAGSVVTNNGTQTLTNKTLTAPVIGAAVATSIESLTSGLIFEGSTADASETTLTAADPTADVTYLLPDAATGSYGLMSSTLATNAPDIANSVTGASAGLKFEGTADAHETTLTATDATADRTATLPNATGTVALSQASTTTALTADDQAVTPGSSTVLQLTSDNATATNRTFTLSATGAITGQIYVLIGPATNQCEIADTGIQVLSATWSPTTGDTLTLLFDGTNFNELARSNN